MKMRVLCNQEGKIIAAHFVDVKSDKSKVETGKSVVKAPRYPRPSTFSISCETQAHRAHEIAVPQKWIGDHAKLARGLSEHRVTIVGKHPTLVRIANRKAKAKRK